MKELALHILDILQNSTRAKANKIELNIFEDTKENVYSIEIKDDGCGMSPELLARVTDPFTTSRTTRKVGLGVPLFKHTAEQSGGHLEITSKEGVGTTIKATMQHDHIDRPILGSVAAVFVQTVASNPEIRFIYTHTKDGKSYAFDTKEVNEALDGMPIQSPEVINYLISMINENLKEIGVN